MDRPMAQAYRNHMLRQVAPEMSASADAMAPLVMLLEQQGRLSRGYAHLFDYLGLRSLSVRADQALAAMVRAKRPMAIFWAADADGFEPCQVMAAIAEHDRALPLLIVADEDARSLGIIEVLEELWGLSEVQKSPADPELRDVVEFLFRAGRKNGTCRMLSV